MENQTQIQIFIDGAARNNPGPAGAGVYILLGDTILHQSGYYLGKKTNNQAEYLALLLAAFIAQDLIEKQAITNPHLAITSDSELLVKQMTGQYRVRNPIIAQIKRAIDGQLKDRSCTFTHVFRHENTMADKLANQGIDTKNKVSPSFVTMLDEYEIVL